MPRTVPPNAPPSPFSEKVYTRTMAPRTMSVEIAVTRLERSDDEVLVFINDATQRLAVAYRRKDGSYGLVKPSGV